MFWHIAGNCVLLKNMKNQSVLNEFRLTNAPATNSHRAFLVPGRSFGRHWCIFEPLRGPWVPLGAPRVDFHGFWEPFWRSLGGSFSCFFQHKFNVDFEVDFGMDFKHIFDDFLMILGWCFDTLLETANSWKTSTTHWFLMNFKGRSLQNMMNFGCFS